MLTPKQCKWCGSVWHSKNKCESREISPFKLLYSKKGTNSPPSRQNASERPRLAHKGMSERSQLIGYADKYFSVYIRTRGGDGSTNTCYTCYVRLPYDDLQCGHFIARRYLNTRWNEMNCHPQCNDCNVIKGGNLKVYEERLRAEYGDDNIDALKIFAHTLLKFTDPEIQLVIDEYKGLCSDK